MNKISIASVTSIFLLATALMFGGQAVAQNRRLDAFGNLAGTIANVAGAAAALSAAAAPPGPAGADAKAHLKPATVGKGHVSVHGRHH